jgi:hypothetical protein
MNAVQFLANILWFSLAEHMILSQCELNQNNGLKPTAYIARAPPVVSLGTLLAE